MFLSVLTKNLNWESLTKNLVNFNFIMGGSSKKLIFLERGGTVFRIKGEEDLVKIERVFSLPHFGRRACHDITKSADSQTNINFFSK